MIPMNQQEQRDSLETELTNTVCRHVIECDLSKAEIIGVMECVKMFFFERLYDEDIEITLEDGGEEEE